MNENAPTHVRSGRGILDRLPYPHNALIQKAARSPLLLWRLGFGPVIGKTFLILSHIGRMTGRVRRSALEYHRVNGRIFVVSAWSRSDWFQNIQAEPRVTVQTDKETLHAMARVLQSNAEYLEAYQVFNRNPVIRAALEAAGVDISLTNFLANKEQFQIVTFDSTELPTPPPLKADLKWVSPLVIGTFALGYLTGKLDR